MSNNIVSISNNSLLLTSPDYQNIRSLFVNYLQAQPQFTDYNFEGSNFSVLIDLLAYNSYIQAFLTNMVATEMFLDTAQEYPSVSSRAKELGYTPRSTTSAVAYVDVQVYPANTPASIILPANFSFSTSMGNQSYNFYTTQANLILPANGVYIISNVEIVEGFPVTDVFTVNNNSNTNLYTLSNPTIDTSTIQVFVTETGNAAQYSFADNIADLAPNSNVYFVQQDFSLKYQIEFGDGVISYSPAINALIQVNYMASSADIPNGANSFLNSTAIGGYSNVVVTTAGAAIGGAPPEDINLVRYYAPLMSQTKGRAVVQGDYEILLLDKFPEIKAIHAFGGENLNPPQYGQVVIVVNLGTGIPALPQSRVTAWTNYIASKNPTLITPIFIAPQYIDVKINSTVFYDYTQTTRSQSDIRASVFNSISNYNNTVLDVFDTSLRYSKLIAAIDDTDASINSNETVLLLEAPLNLSLLANNNSQTINFYNSIAENNGLRSDTFTYNNSICQIASRIDGGLYITPSIGVEDDLIQVVKQAGTIDFQNGIVTVFPIQFGQIFGTGVNIYATTQNQDIVASQNILLSIDLSNINIQVVPQLWNKR